MELVVSINKITLTNLSKIKEADKHTYVGSFWGARRKILKYILVTDKNELLVLVTS